MTQLSPTRARPDLSLIDAYWLLLAVAGVIVLAHSPAQAPPRPRRVR